MLASVNLGLLGADVLRILGILAGALAAAGVFVYQSSRVVLRRRRRGLAAKAGLEVDAQETPVRRGEEVEARISISASRTIGDLKVGGARGRGAR